MPRRVTVRGIIVKNGKLFAQKLKNKDGGEKDFWCTPGGGLEEGETIYEGLTRELIEETGISPKIGKLLYVQQYKENAREYLEFFFQILNPDDYRDIDLAATTHGEIEVSQFGFIQPKDVYLLPEFLQTIDLSKEIHVDEVRIFEYLKGETK